MFAHNSVALWNWKKIIRFARAYNEAHRYFPFHCRMAQTHFHFPALVYCRCVCRAGPRYLCPVNNSRVSEANQVPISSHVGVTSTTFNQFKTYKKNRKKLKSIFMTILELAESFKTTNLSDPTVTLFDGLFI